MTLRGEITQAAPGLIGLDQNSFISEQQAKLLFERNFRFCVRYISRTDAIRESNAANGLPDLSQAEAQGLLDAGLAIMVVQHPPLAGSSPTGDLGAAYGKAAASYAADAGLPAGVCLWLDLEGVREATPAQDVINYCNAWFAAVTQSGYIPSAYIGADPGLDADALFFDLRTEHYWRGLSRDIPDISHRGYQLFQRAKPDASSGKIYDQDVTQNDSLGGSVIWLAPPAQSTSRR